MQKRILFITWDGPQTSYMEGLFLPIFHEIKKRKDIDFHVMQFTWAAAEKTAAIASVAKSYGIHYISVPILRKPVAILGNIWTLFTGIKIIATYIKQYNITIVMPRSTMPAVMVNRLSLTNVKILFDADGLPLEERVDFSGLSKTSRQYQWLKQEETKLLRRADYVITRSQKAIALHLQNIGEAFKNKFGVVFNGRNEHFFKKDKEKRAAYRKLLSIADKETVFVYCGSLGPQYGWEEMLAIFKGYYQKNNISSFLILTGNKEFAQQRIPAEFANGVRVLSVPFEEVPDYLNVADIAFAIRKPTFSMQGVAPIKLGEYLLMGLPTIASKGIGDTTQLLENIKECYLFNHDDKNSIAEAIAFAENTENLDSEILRDVGVSFFSLEKSAESYLKALDRL